MLELRNIHKKFGELEVLKGVDIAVEKGDIVVILGPSGSGKTTLLRCINFLERADEGSLRFDEIQTEFSKASKKDINAVRKKSAFEFQNYGLFDNKTVLDNVTEGLIVGRKVPKKEAIEAAIRALEKVGLSDRLAYYPSQLSGGQQQRVGIARALVNDPIVLLADEPTGNLDSRSGAEILQLFDELHGQGKTIIMVTHDDEIGRRSQRVIRLRDGQVESDIRNG